MNRHRRRRTTFSDPEIAMAGTIRGCRCRPDFKRRHVDGLARVDVYHDHDCPAVDTGPQLLIRLDRQETPQKLIADLLRALEDSA